MRCVNLQGTIRRNLSNLMGNIHQKYAKKHVLRNKYAIILVLQEIFPFDSEPSLFIYSVR